MTKIIEASFVRDSDQSTAATLGRRAAQAEIFREHQMRSRLMKTAMLAQPGPATAVEAWLAPAVRDDQIAYVYATSELDL